MCQRECNSIGLLIFVLDKTLAMKKLMYLGIFISFFGLTSCNVGDDDLVCATGPVELYLEFVGEETGENLYSNGTFQQGSIEITNEEGAQVPYNFIRDLDRTFLRLNLGMEAGEQVITIEANDEVILDLELTIAAQEGNCTSYYISEFEVPGYEYDQEGAPGVVRILF